MSSEDTKVVKKTSKPKTSDHPKYSVMIQAAIKALKDRKGSSRQSIVKYVLANYNLGATEEKKVIQNVKMSLRGSVKNGKLFQTRGTGASGSFKLPVVEKGAAAEKPKPAPKKSKSAAKKKPKSPMKSKSPSPKAKSPSPKAKSPKAKSPKTKAKAVKKPKAKKAAKPKAAKKDATE